MGLFYKFKKKNLKSTPEEIKKIEEPKTDDRIELTLDNLYSELANTIISTLPMEWEVFHYLGEVESNKNSWSSNVIKLRNDGFEENTKNVLLFFLWKI